MTPRYPISSIMAETSTFLASIDGVDLWRDSDFNFGYYVVLEVDGYKRWDYIYRDEGKNFGDVTDLIAPSTAEQILAYINLLS